MKRSIYRVQWNKKEKVWDIRSNGMLLGWYTLKKHAEIGARSHCRRVWEIDHQPCQLLIYRKDGKIGKGGRSEASYGCDSKRRKG
jgi:hypothetical protein